MILQVAARFPRLVSLAREVNRARAASPGAMPRGADLVALQHAADSAGGLPRLAAEPLASYTAVPIAPDRARTGGPTRTVAGRTATVPAGPGGVSESWPERHGRPAVDTVSVDGALVDGVLVGGVLVRSSKLAFLRAMLAAMVDDVDANRSRSTVASNLASVDRVFGEIGAPARLEQVDVGGGRSDGTDLAVRMEMRAGSRLSEHAVLSLSAAGVVHGRLGAIGASDAAWWTCTHWETARRVSPECRDFLVEVMVAAGGAGPHTGSGADALVRSGAELGIPEEALVADLRPLLELLAPVARRLAPMVVPARYGDATGVRRVPDSLGVMYGLADLLALR